MITLLLACSSEPAAPPPAPKPAPVAPKPNDFNDKMATHFDLAAAARDALVRGDLFQAKEAVSRLVLTRPPEAPETWQAPLDRMREAAGRAALAESLTGVAQEVTLLAEACGDCHKATGGGPTQALQAALASTPPAGEDLKSHMRLHQWSVDQMWLGLAGPSPELFAKGAQALHESKAQEAGAPNPEMARLAEQVHAMAESASVASTPEERRELYALFLSSCADCHKAAGVAVPAAAQDAAAGH